MQDARDDLYHILEKQVTNEIGTREPFFGLQSLVIPEIRVGRRASLGYTDPPDGGRIKGRLGEGRADPGSQYPKGAE